MQVICPRCGHGDVSKGQKAWDYSGKNTVTKCPKCKKHVNIRKSLMPSPSQMLPTPQGHVEDFNQGKISSPSLPENSEIIVQDVPVTVPDQLKNIKGEVTPEQKKEQEQARVQNKVEIPYRTVEILCEMPFNLWAGMEKDDAFKLSAMEKESLTPLVQQYLNAHMGSWFSNYSGEIAIAIVAGLIISTRIAIKAKKGTLKLGRQPAAESNNSAPVAPTSDNKPSWAKEE